MTALRSDQYSELCRLLVEIEESGTELEYRPG